MESRATAVFLSATAVLVYSVAGYPLLLAVLARLFPRPVCKAPGEKTVSILLPVRNGERWIGPKLDSLLALEYPRRLVEIVVVSDGSRDRTEEIVSGYANRGVRLERIAGGGKAVALNRGMELASGEILFFTDVRQPLDPDCLSKLIACFAGPEVGAVTGELVILDGSTSSEANVGLYWKYEKWIRCQLSRAGSMLTTTGCVYAMRRALARPLPPATILDDAVLPIRAVLAGYRVVFEQDAKAYDHPTALDVEFRRKVRTLAGVLQVARLHPQLLLPFRSAGFHFLSHKMSRLAAPYALLAALGSAPFLPWPWSAWCLGSQVAFYVLAAADPLVPERFPLKGASSPCRTAAVLMLASLLAASYFFVPSERLWKPTETRAPRARED
ncbi:MAG: glycosyltransferase family 2 protein [Acidobacteria bacterium]|nr:glycosyltransferase family 2 protein [Acidobacteriota bacterium]